VTPKDLLLDGRCFHYTRRRPSTTELKLPLPTTASFRSETQATNLTTGDEPRLRSDSLGSGEGKVVDWHSEGQWTGLAREESREEKWEMKTGKKNPNS